ncbi:MAG: TIGR04086 family membrane protein [Oscillospiraceae bacterium]|nr:TIGR04086 family membrane protein [Oscillospiraceae bacterium]
MIAVGKKREERMSFPLRTIWGVVAASVVTLIASCALSFLVFTDKINEERIDLGVCVVLIAASFVGCLLSTGFAKARLALQGALTSASFLSVLLAFNVLILGAELSGFLVRALMVAVGGIAAILVSAGKGRKKRHR